MVRRAVLALFVLTLALGSWSAAAQPQPDDAVVPDVEPLDDVPDPEPEAVGAEAPPTGDEPEAVGAEAPPTGDEDAEDEDAEDEDADAADAFADAPDDPFGDMPEAFDPDELGGDDADEAGPLFTFNGFVQAQGGVFTDWMRHNTQREDAAGDKYWTDHGDLLGKPSLMRATIQLEGDWNPSKYASVHAEFRGARSLQLQADRIHAEPPSASISDPVAWAHRTYYNEADLREFFIDINPASWLNLRVGRQQVAWGDLGQYRLLDVINPTNSTWHFANLESYEDMRVPLWMFKSQIDIQALKGSLEFVWVPLVDRPEDRVTVPLTFVGAWGLPLAGPRDYKSSLKIDRKTLLYPGGDIEDSRVGARWIGNLGNVSYTLVYYFTHQLTPPVPTGFYQRWDEAKGAINNDIDVQLAFPRQHIAGFSLEYMFQSPVSTVFRLEASYTPNEHFSGASVPSGDLISNDFVAGEDFWTNLPTFEKHMFSYGVQFMRPTFIRPLNPNQTFMFVLQALHSVVLDYKKSERMVSVPGFDSTATKQHSLVTVVAVVTNYLHGLLQPKIVLAYIPDLYHPAWHEQWKAKNSDSGFLITELGFLLGNSWRMQVGWCNFFGRDPYKGVGLFRDRDEAYLRIRYQF
ncbi:MAG: DUF1302 family protein [Pseudomonadota bacterium]